MLKRDNKDGVNVIPPLQLTKLVAKAKEALELHKPADEEDQLSSKELCSDHNESKKESNTSEKSDKLNSSDYGMEKYKRQKHVKGIRGKKKQKEMKMIRIKKKKLITFSAHQTIVKPFWH